MGTWDGKFPVNRSIMDKNGKSFILSSVTKHYRSNYWQREPQQIFTDIQVWWKWARIL